MQIYGHFALMQNHRNYTIHILACAYMFFILTRKVKKKKKYKLTQLFLFHFVIWVHSSNTLYLHLKRKGTVDGSVFPCAMSSWPAWGVGLSREIISRWGVPIKGEWENLRSYKGMWWSSLAASHGGAMRDEGMEMAGSLTVGALSALRWALFHSDRATPA